MYKLLSFFTVLLWWWTTVPTCMAQKYPQNNTVTTTKEPNQKGTWVLVVHTQGQFVPEQSVSFVVYDKKKKKNIYEETIGQGTVQWLDNTHLEITRFFGIPKVDENGNSDNGQQKYILDLTTKQKKALSNHLRQKQ